MELPLGRGETILLVEDDETIMKMVKKLLEHLGYTVLSANSPVEATQLATEHVDEIDLLITDVVMPAMNGRELSENLQSLYPHLKTLFMSGYPADILAYKDVLEDGISFIAKPFSKDELALKIREALTEGNRSQGLYSAKQFLLTKSKPFH
jgi:CheY-like chemotaxis protein